MLDYSFLRVFGSKCFPYLRGYAKNKLEPHSLPCVFLGYSEFYKGYICFHPPINRVYLSRYVVFDENIFPFKTLGSLYGTTCNIHDLTEFSEWTSGDLAAKYNHAPLDSSLEAPLLDQVTTNDQEATHLPDLPSVDVPVNANDQVAQDQSMFNALLDPILEDTSIRQSDSDEHDPGNSTNRNGSLQNGSSNDEVAIVNADSTIDEEVLLDGINPIDIAINSPQMVTRRSHGITKPNLKYFNDDFCLVATNIPCEPKTFKSTLKHLGWAAAMTKEIFALRQNETWDLVP